MDKNTKNSLAKCNAKANIEFQLNNLYKKYSNLDLNYGLLKK